MSSAHHAKANESEREKLGPVAGMIFGLYLVILLVGYFTGNLIYQIP